MRKFICSNILTCLLALFAAADLRAQEKPTVAVVPFEAYSGISAENAAVITRVFFLRLRNTEKVEVVNRDIVDQQIRAQQFEAGDWSSSEKIAALGRASNANWLVRGTIERLGSMILVTVEFFDVNTQISKGGADMQITNEEDAYYKIEPIINKLVATAIPAKVYKNGETGPGGGIVFSAVNGTYLECTSRSLGEAKWSDARAMAKSYQEGGFHDWRLPTLAELKLIQANTSHHLLDYWSSDQESIAKAYGVFGSLTRVWKKTDSKDFLAVRSFTVQ
ncbi:MAG: DUF1566 domain-containing protein [Spirochaetota bacterium]|jgi:TolB-like protein|nr:DUF1566 domain-containing protein [Spirochaetota bacterium]